jgi:hypothetical protein
VLVVTPVATFVAVTFAPATTAPLGSVTVPRTDPVIVWATTAVQVSNRQKQIPIIAFEYFFISLLGFVFHE